MDIEIKNITIKDIKELIDLVKEIKDYEIISFEWGLQDGRK